MSDQAEEITTEEEPPKGIESSQRGVRSVPTVESIKDYLAEREATARYTTPEGMELVGWLLDGWVATYPLMDGNARPVYAFPRD